MHDLATIQRKNREAALAAIADSVTEADEVAEQAEATHKACGKPVTFDREHISDGNVEDYPEAQHGHYYAAACLHCDEDLMEFEIEYPQPTQDERAEAMERHPAGKGRGKRLTEPAIDPATEPEQDEPGSGERTTKPLKPAEVAHLASASAHELARKVLAGFTKNGEIPFALTGQAALDIIAVAIEADRAQRDA